MSNTESVNNAGCHTQGLYIKIVAFFIFALLFPINPGHEYGWFMGLLHGSWTPYYWIISLFSDTALCKAPLHTAAYGIWWWIGLAVSLFYIATALVLTISRICRRSE